MKAEALRIAAASPMPTRRMSMLWRRLLAVPVAIVEGIAEGRRLQDEMTARRGHRPHCE